MSATPPPPPPSDSGPPPSSPPPSASPPPEESGSDKSFFARLFDLSFSEFVTPSLIKLIYIIFIIIAAIAAVAVFAAFAADGGASVVIGIILAPIVFFVYVLFARVMAEIYLILFKIEENTRR